MAQKNEFEPMATDTQRAQKLKLDLPANVEVLIAILPPPLHIFLAWDDELRRYKLSDGNSRSTPRAACQVFAFLDQSVHVVTLPAAPYDLLRSLVAAHPVSAWVYGITRMVTGGDGSPSSQRGTTRYTIRALRPMTPREREMVDSARRLDLKSAVEELYGVNQAAAIATSDSASGSTLATAATIGAEDLAALGGLVEQMTDSVRTTLFASFGVSDLAKLPASMVDPAKRLALQLMSESDKYVNNI